MSNRPDYTREDVLRSARSAELSGDACKAQMLTDYAALMARVEQALDLAANPEQCATVESRRASLARINSELLGQLDQATNDAMEANHRAESFEADNATLRDERDRAREMAQLWHRAYRITSMDTDALTLATHQHHAEEIASWPTT